MRIARILTRLNLGGPARQVLASDPLLVQRGHTLRIFCGAPEPGEGDLSAELRERGLELVQVPGLARGWRVAADLRAKSFLKRELARYQPQIVHTHASKAGALGRVAARGLDALCVHTFHGHVLEGYFSKGVSRGLLAVERRLARETQRIVAVSHATGSDLVRLGVVGEDKLTVIVPGLDLDPLLEIDRSARAAASPFREKFGLVGGDFLVLVIGRLAPVKRPLLALEVWHSLATRYANLHLVFVGDGELRSAVEAARSKLPDAHRVHLAGNHWDMPSVFAGADLVLSCSSSEGMPVALIEAAAAGLPVVATPVGGVPELVALERTGFLGDSADELAYGVARVMEMEDRGRALGVRARLRVKDRHSARALADRLESLYAALLKEQACAS